MRALADTMAKAETKATMLKLADDYDKLGDRRRAPGRGRHRNRRRASLAVFTR
jgi:hypothetical protein